MQDFNGTNGYYTFIEKGDLVEYTVEGFTMNLNSGFVIEEYKYIGLVVSDLIESRDFGSVGGIMTLGSPTTESIDLPYFKIFCIKTQQITYIPIDKIKIIKSRE